MNLAGVSENETPSERSGGGVFVCVVLESCCEEGGIENDER